MLLGVGIAATPVQADAIPWTGSTGNDWNNAGNWEGGSVPGDEDIAEFHNPGAGNLSLTLSSSSTIDGLAFNANASSPVTIHVTTGTPLALDGGAATDISVATGSHTIEGAGAGAGDLPEIFALGGNQVWDIAAGATLVINAKLRGEDWPGGTSYTKTGAGTLVLGASNSGGGNWNFHGKGFELRAGTLKITNRYATGDWHNNYAVSDGAAIEVTGGISLFEMRHGILRLRGDGVDGGGALIIATGTSTNFPSGDGSMILLGDTTIGVSADSTFTIAQNIGNACCGGKSLTKVGEGSLVLSSEDSTYTGNTIVDEGELTLDPAGELRFRLRDSGVSNTIIGSGAATLDGLLRIDASRVTDIAAAWNLVNVDTLDVTWGETFGLGFLDEEAPEFIHQGGGVFTSGDWTFRQSTGTLRLGLEPEDEVRLTAEGIGNELRLSWPVGVGDYVLETTPNLAMADWQPVDGTPELQDDQYVLMVPMEGRSAFFRLRLQ